MKKYLSIIAVFLATGSLHACSSGDDGHDTPESTIPTIETVEISAISITSAVTGGTIITDGGEPIAAKGVCWDTSPNPVADGNYISDPVQSDSFSITISGLNPSTTYYVRAFAVNGNGIAYGQERSFTTLAAPEGLAVVETTEITRITTSSATTGGTVMSDGGVTVTSRGICWSTSRNPTTESEILTDYGQDASFTITIEELSPATTYYVRAFATNATGTAYGTERSFTTRSEGGGIGDPSQRNIHLWAEGNMAATTSYQTVANSSNPDGPDFRPNMVYYPVPEGIAVKGAILICPGGAFQFRSGSEGAPVAQAFSELGYQSFVVNYRLRPYTQQEGALDLQRGVRFVRANADYYGIDEEDIAVMGFSAGGILCGEQVLHWRGTVNGTSLDNNYVPDALDNVSADVQAIGHIYSFYGRLSVASTDVELFRRSNLPPAFFCYGTEDPFYNQFNACVRALQEANTPVESHVLQGWPHGYGARGDWIPVMERWMADLFRK